MRVLFHHDEAEKVRDRCLELVPEIETALCRAYADLPAALASFAPDAVFHVRFESGPYPTDAVVASPGASWLACSGVGVDHLGEWDPERLTVTNGAGAAAEAMAWHVLGSIIALTLKYPRFAREQAARRWRGRLVGTVPGKTVCVVGLGHVGRAVARLCKALGLSVVGARVNPRPTECVDRVYGADRLREALAGADYAVVCTPKTRRTAGLIDAGALAAMKPGACLIDVSRGGVTVADDLIAALRSGHLGGASLDVFDPEPMPADCPLWDMENVLVTPHASATFEGWELRGVEIFAGNLGRRMAGEPLFNVVDPARGY